jgi:hypothetical protein
MALVVGNFGLKVEYVLFGQGFGTSHRRLKKLALLDVLITRNI